MRQSLLDSRITRTLAVGVCQAQVFYLLGKNKIIDEELSDNLAEMSRFRNLLVHGYGKVDNQRMLSIMRENLNDIEEFLLTLSKIIKEQRNNKHD